MAFWFAMSRLRPNILRDKCGDAAFVSGRIRLVRFAVAGLRDDEQLLLAAGGIVKLAGHLERHERVGISVNEQHGQLRSPYLLKRRRFREAVTGNPNRTYYSSGACSRSNA